MYVILLYLFINILIGVHMSKKRNRPSENDSAIEIKQSNRITAYQLRCKLQRDIRLQLGVILVWVFNDKNKKSIHEIIRNIIDLITPLYSSLQIKGVTYAPKLCQFRLKQATETRENGLTQEIMLGSVGTSLDLEELVSHFSEVRISGGVIDSATVFGLHLPLGVSVDQYAFQGSSNLAEITVARGASIGVSAFEGCGKLTAVTFPEGVYISSYAFKDCIGITNLSIPGYTTIGIHAFSDCTGLSHVAIGSHAVIEHDAFNGCTGLASVDIGSETEIGAWSFVSCTRLAELSIGSGSSLAQEAFSGCTEIICLTIEPSVVIDSTAFQSCSGISYLKIDSGVYKRSLDILSLALANGCSIDLTANASNKENVPSNLSPLP